MTSEAADRILARNIRVQKLSDEADRHWWRLRRNWRLRAEALALLQENEKDFEILAGGEENHD